MPQIEIEYSATLPVGDVLRDLALALHREIADLADADPTSFKTRMSPLTQVVIADGDDRNAVVHLDIRLLSGRSDAVKTAVGQAGLKLLRQHLEPHVSGFATQFSVEVRDLDRAHYHKHLTSV